jgi:aspartokinase
MRNHSTIVQKYGGACLETPAKIRAVARSLADLHGRGHRVVAIVSAMGKTTDQLIKIAYEVSPAPNRRELDMLLTTGERISMSLHGAIRSRRARDQLHRRDDRRLPFFRTHSGCTAYSRA